MIVTMQDYTITDRAPVLIGYEGENLSRNFTVKTFDDLSAIASIELLIGDVNCGAMTVNNTDDTEITISLDAFMIGRAGYKKAQLIMLDDTGAIVMKSNQFDVLVGASNNPRYYAAGEKVKTLTVSIDGRTRQIILPAGFAVSVNGDVAVDHIAFKAPASYGDFDFGAAACRVDWIGVDGTSHTNICVEKDADGNWIWALPTVLTRGGEGEISFSVSYIVTDATTGAVTADWNTGLVKFYHLESAKSDDAEEDVEEETTYDRLASAIAAVRAAQASVDDVNAILAGITSATPTVVETVADLNGLDTSKVKLAIVAADGYLHYYDGTTWKSGFAYGGLQEVIAARTDSDGVTHTDLKTRLNTAEAQIKEDLNQNKIVTDDKIRVIEERIETDETLTKHKRPADAKIVGDELDLIKDEYGLNDNVKDALLTIASNIAYTNTNGRIYYNALHDALYPHASKRYGYKYNPSNVVTGACIDETGNIITAGANSGYYDDFISKIYSNELAILYIAPSVVNANFRVSIYDSSFNFVRQIHFEVQNQKFGIVTVNFDENEKFIKLGWYSEGTSIDPLSDIAFYLSSAADEMIMSIGSISVTTGEEESDSRRLRSTFISVKNDLTVIGYPFGSVVDKNGWVVRCYDSSYAYISSVPDGALQSKKAVFNTTLPEGTAFIRFIYQESSNKAYTQGWSENIVEDFWVNGHRYRFEEE